MQHVKKPVSGTAAPNTVKQLAANQVPAQKKQVSTSKTSFFYPAANYGTFPDTFPAKIIDTTPVKEIKGPSTRK